MAEYTYNLVRYFYVDGNSNKKNIFKKVSESLKPNTRNVYERAPERVFMNRNIITVDFLTTNVHAIRRTIPCRRKNYKTNLFVYDS